jgi:hypothetical protein
MGECAPLSRRVKTGRGELADPHPTMTGAVPAEPTSPRQHLEFLVELAVAFHKSAIYPPAHPMLRGAIGALVARLATKLADRPHISIGVAHDQLVIDGAPTTGDNPHLKAIARHLHDQQIGAVRFSQGVTAEELSDFLNVVAREASGREIPLGLMGPEVLRRWSAIALYGMAYDRLELMEGGDEDVTAAPDAGAREADARGAALWIGLAQAALAGECTDEPQDAAPEALAGAIDARVGDRAYEQAVVGYMVQIARDVARTEGTTPNAALQQRVSQLVRTMKGTSLARLLEMGGDVAQQKRFMLDANDGLVAGAVVDVLKAAATGSQFHVSQPLIRMLTKLANHAEEQDTAVRARADGELREQVRRLLDGWDLSDPNPGSYTAALSNISRNASAHGREVHGDPCEPERILELSSEVDVFGPATRRAISALLARDGVAACLTMIDVLPPSATRERCLDAVLTGDLLCDVAVAERADADLVGRIVERIGVGAVDPLLDALEKAGERVAVIVSDALVRVGRDAVARIGERVMAFAPTSQRVLLGVFDRVGEWPPRIEPATFARHVDGGVRREAIGLMLKSPSLRSLGLELGAADADPRCYRLALRAALEGGFSPAAMRAFQRRVDDSTLDRDLRARTVGVIAARGNDEAVEWLIERLTRPHWLHRGVRLKDRSSQLLAGIAGLARRRPTARTDAILALAAESRDAEIRAAAVRRSVEAA